MKLFYYIMVLFFSLMLNYNIAANDSIIDSKLIDLIERRINDEKLSVSITYSSNTKLLRIKRKESDIVSITLENFDKDNKVFVAKVSYKSGLIDNISGSYHLFLDVPVAARSIKPGEIIDFADIKFIKSNLEQLKKNIFTSESDLVGKQAKKYIQLGAAFTIRDISKPVVIKVNDPVNIIYNSGLISLRISGIALNSGAVGDVIKVKNSTSGIVLLGAIVNKNTIQIGEE